MNLKLIVSLIFLFSLTSLAQQLSINGVVKDQNNQPIAFCNVSLTEVENKTSVLGTTTNDDGTFIIDNLKPIDYLLKISFLGFESYQDSISLKNNLSIGAIILKEQTQNLDGVIVIAKRPTIKRMVDRIVFNVENSTLSNNNVLDVLKNTPGVLIFNEDILVKNSTPTIYINDRKVHLSSNEVQQLLEGTSASNVKSIEVITNPPAKYEAEGGAVINIITSKNIVSGYNGSIFGNYKQGEQYPKYSVGTSHFFKTEKVDAYINYGISPRKDYRHENESIHFIENNAVSSSWETDFKRTRESSNQTVNANIDFTLDDYNSIGISTNMLISPRDNNKISVNSLTEVFGSNSVLDSTFLTKNRLVDETYNLGFTFDYVHKFKREGEKLSINAHYTDYDFSSYQNVDTDYRFPDESLIRTNRFQTFSSQDISLFTAQLDYELPIDESTQFETGFKISNIDSENIINQFTFVNGSKIEDLQNSDTFLYDETNYAAYLSYSKDLDHWNFKWGLRGEFTNIQGNSLSTTEINENEYLKLFPSLYVLHSLNEHHDLYFNYTKRIDRPRYIELNPFKYYLNDNSYSMGNPNLKPEVDDVFTLGYTLNKKYTFEAYFRNENNATLEIQFQDNVENILKYIYINVDKTISYGLDFTTYTKIATDWNLYVLSSLFYDEFQFSSQEINNILVTNNQWSFYSQIINYFSFLKDKSLTADVSYLYVAPIAYGSSDVSSRHGLDINLKKTLWKNKASVNIGISDAFNTQNFTQTRKYLNQDTFVKTRFENRLFTFGFNYKFGNTRLKNNQKDFDLEERERLQSKSN
ncbi:outer membrane beta-barrel family protein [Gaetbulibacter aquiaggeris]|uniref:Outer membrane beta-barrel family protein n=1 Tax=Gaetbulibacter aquiaggeris TaxID=1735373 RepID=A0ABW7MR13_9FLAO